MSKNSRLVYSTDLGRIKEQNTEPLAPTGDGIIRIQRETKGRGGKAVSVVSGVPEDQLKSLCKLLKSKCATGGSVKDSLIEIQGDHREKIKLLVEKQGFKVKLAGG